MFKLSQKISSWRQRTKMRPLNQQISDWPSKSMAINKPGLVRKICLLLIIFIKRYSRFCRKYIYIPDPKFQVSLELRDTFLPKYYEKKHMEKLQIFGRAGLFCIFFWLAIRLFGTRINTAYMHRSKRVPTIFPLLSGIQSLKTPKI